MSSRRAGDIDRKSIQCSHFLNCSTVYKTRVAPAVAPIAGTHQALGFIASSDEAPL